MMEKMVRKLALMAVLASMASGALALTVSVVPSEETAYAPPPAGSGSPLGFLVSGCMNRLFDSGYIVTDAEAFREPRSSWLASGAALTGAREGFVDYIVALYVDWSASAFRKDTLLPAGIGYSLIRVSDGKILLKGDIAGSPDSEEASAHFERTASQAGAEAALPCVKILETLAMGGE
jgi:hypothetical protein